MVFMRLLPLVILLHFVASAELGAAVVKGKVMFLTGSGPAPGVNETVVRLEAAGRMPRRPGATFTMTVRGGKLDPHVLLVPAGSTVAFPNHDSTPHDLFSDATGNAFALGSYGRGKGESATFTAPGIVNVSCRIHPDESGVVHVLDTPYYGFADAYGNFAFDVPPGIYTVTGWNERAGTISSEIELAEDGTVTGATLLTIDARKLQAGQ